MSKNACNCEKDGSGKRPVVITVLQGPNQTQTFINGLPVGKVMSNAPTTKLIEPAYNSNQPSNERIPTYKRPRAIGSHENQEVPSYKRPRDTEIGGDETVTKGKEKKPKKPYCAIRRSKSKSSTKITPQGSTTTVKEYKREVPDDPAYQQMYYVKQSEKATAVDDAIFLLPGEKRNVGPKKEVIYQDIPENVYQQYSDVPVHKLITSTPQAMRPPTEDGMLPIIKPRYHGDKCALEVTIMEKHSPNCSLRKSRNPYRHPKDDRSGSYEAIGRTTFLTCSDNGELAETDKITEVYSFISATLSSAYNPVPSTSGRCFIDHQKRDNELEPLKELQKLFVNKSVIESLANSSKSFTDPLQRYPNLNDDEEEDALDYTGILGIVSSNKSIQMTPKVSAVTRRTRGRKWYSYLIPCVDSDENYSHETYLQAKRSSATSRLEQIMVI